MHVGVSGSFTLLGGCCPPHRSPYIKLNRAPFSAAEVRGRAKVIVHPQSSRRLSFAGSPKTTQRCFSVWALCRVRMALRTGIASTSVLFLLHKIDTMSRHYLVVTSVRLILTKPKWQIRVKQRKRTQF